MSLLPGRQTCAIAGSEQTALSQPGSISGKVVDEQGSAVLHATVYYIPEDRVGPGLWPTATADSKGEFVFNKVEPGRYRVCALKEGEAYPDTNRTFYDAYVPYPTVNVYPGRATDGVVIRLGPKGAWIKGRALDAQTGLPVRRAGITFYAEKGAQVYMGTTTGKLADFAILVPSTKAFRMRVDAPGYATWYYGSDGTEEHTTPIRLAPGAVKELDVKLRPLNDQEPATQ